MPRIRGHFLFLLIMYHHIQYILRMLEMFVKIKTCPNGRFERVEKL